MLPDGPAVILIIDPPMTRAAALVYRTPQGLGWLEPEYFGEEPPTRPAWHEFAGAVTDTDRGVLLQGPEQSILVIDATLAGPEHADIKRELAALKAKLVAVGTSLAEQRTLLEPQVLGDAEQTR